MKRKNQRLVLLIFAILAGLGVILLGMYGVRNQAAFFKFPADIARDGIPLDRAVRVGGMVKRGSIRRQPDGVTIDFLIGDQSSATIPVHYRGIVPDLFREDSSVIADGRFLPNGTFVASEILAKQDENYVPPEVARRLAQQGNTLK